MDEIREAGSGFLIDEIRDARKKSHNVCQEQEAPQILYQAKLPTQSERDIFKRFFLKQRISDNSFANNLYP